MFRDVRKVGRGSGSGVVVLGGGGARGGAVKQARGWTMG